ncbi:hypothetical protein [Arthrobacter sp.]|uniref:hypothetical protein n=1 Tax=Arthrobacter sp. TaxID=1667 RepID=UPI003A8D2DFD
MSTATQSRAVHADHGRVGVNDGANARAWAPSPLRHAESKQRTPLSLVPATRRSRRAGFAAFCFALLLAALVGVLVINVNVANSQYDIVGLNADEQALTQQNEALTQELQNLQAPQNVAAKAAELGMVTPGAVASINLKSQKITGTSTPAEKGKTPTSLVAAPEAPGDQAERGASDGKTADSSTSTTSDDKAPEGNAVAGGASANESTTTENTQDSSAKELNGGTIPAPAQQDSGQ